MGVQQPPEGVGGGHEEGAEGDGHQGLRANRGQDSSGQGAPCQGEGHLGGVSEDYSEIAQACGRASWVAHEVRSPCVTHGAASPWASGCMYIAWALRDRF